MSSFFLRCEVRLAAWLERRRRHRLMAEFGGIQWCPWCRQIAQDAPGWKFEVYRDNEFHDVLTCGVCGGTSVWHFAMGFHAICALDPPEPKRDFGSGTYVRRSAAAGGGAGSASHSILPGGGGGGGYAAGWER